jgi:hypothetical protein
MKHCYVLVSGASTVTTAETKGRKDLAMPHENRSVRLSVDGTKAIIEGLFTDAECAWFEKNGSVLGDAATARAYLAANAKAWTGPDSGE